MSWGSRKVPWVSVRYTAGRVHTCMCVCPQVRAHKPAEKGLSSSPAGDQQLEVWVVSALFFVLSLLWQKQFFCEFPCRPTCWATSWQHRGLRGLPLPVPHWDLPQEPVFFPEGDLGAGRTAWGLLRAPPTSLGPGPPLGCFGAGFLWVSICGYGLH